MKKILTFSIAAYNVEPYLDQLLQSIIACNKMDEIEVLIVDDGSQDNTAKIARKYADQYMNDIFLISKENGGHGSTINTGIKNATGKYFRTLDGDDWVDSTALAQLITVLADLDTDMVVCDYKKCFSDGREKIETFEGVEANRSYVFDDVAGKMGWICYHTLIYKTSILQAHDICLDEHCFYVDTEYDLLPIPYIETLYYFGQAIYCYRLGLSEQSVSPESKMKHIDNGLTVADRLVEMSSHLDDSLSEVKKDYIINGTADHCIWYIRALLIFPASGKQKDIIKDFDKSISLRNRAVYEAMENHGNESRIIKWLRKSSYQSYWLIKLVKGIKKSY